jgi:cell division septum initiation protein DivIVA
MGNSVKNGIVELRGHKFKRVKNGLDKDQVASFIDELISERDKLAKSHDHLESLTRLAEKTISEADRLAEQIKKEAEEKAEAESAAIIDQAKEQAQKIVEEKEYEAVEIANEKAKAIQSEAEEKVALLLDNERAKINDKLSNFVNQHLSHLLEEMERLKQQVISAQEDWENNLFQSGEGGSAVTAESELEDSAVAADNEDEGSAVAAESKDEDIEVAAESKEENSAATVEELEVIGESSKPSQDQEKTDNPFGIFDLLKGENPAEVGEPQWEVEILPPIDISKMMEIVARLDQLPEVENTEIIPRTDKPSIVVFQREPINLVDLLGKIPEVAYVEEAKTDKDTTNGKTRKVRIGLSGKKA